LFGFFFFCFFFFVFFSSAAFPLVVCSMYPLLKKDGHALNYFALQLFFGVQAMAFARAQLLTRTATAGAGSAASTGSAGSKAVSPPAVVDDGLADNFAASIVRRVNAHPLLAYRTVQVSQRAANGRTRD